MADEPEELRDMNKTISFELAEDMRKVKGESFIIEVLLQEVCKVRPADIFCVRDCWSQGKYDVHLHDKALCTAALGRLEAAAGTEALRGVDFCLGSMRREVPITVHMSNPLCSEEAIVSFLQVYCDSVGKGEKLYNSLGLWNGKMKFGVLLKLDDEIRLGNTVHPPAVFNIGACRGSLTYPRQPKFCGICSTSGHRKAECSKAPCKYCSNKGHDEEDCEFKYDEEEDCEFPPEVLCDWKASDVEDSDLEEYREGADEGWVDGWAEQLGKDSR